MSDSNNGRKIHINTSFTIIHGPSGQHMLAVADGKYNTKGVDDVGIIEIGNEQDGNYPLSIINYNGSNSPVAFGSINSETGNWDRSGGFSQQFFVIPGYHPGKKDGLTSTTKKMLEAPEFQGLFPILKKKAK